MNMNQNFSENIRNLFLTLIVIDTWLDSTKQEKFLS